MFKASRLRAQGLGGLEFGALGLEFKAKGLGSVCRGP